jgi:dGTPase
MLKKQDLERLEEKNLAPYAMRSSQTKGRVHEEQEHPYRTCYQRDRDRIIHSTAFRRLEYKTQVFVIHEGDYYRTRLTHTLEVSQIARSIAKALRLNEELVESIALAHDLGHTPFGHAGEEVLSKIMKKHGGFDHNLQGLRVVDLLEEKYPDFQGLNLSWEVREGIAKHSTLYDKARYTNLLKKFKGHPLLEMQVVDIADEIAYDNHDLDDGMTSRLLKYEDLRKIPLWKTTYTKISKQYSNLKPEIHKYLLIRTLINSQVTDLLKESLKKIKELKITSVDDIRERGKNVISFSSEMTRMRKPLREFLYKNLYTHHRVVRMSDKAHRIIKELFKVYLANPDQLSPTTKIRAKKEGVHRAICDYIAGMTDRFAQEEYKKLFDPYSRV